MKLFDNGHVNEVAELIAKKLGGALSPHASNSLVNQWVRDTPACRNGLTNGESLLTTLLALNKV